MKRRLAWWGMVWVCALSSAAHAQDARSTTSTVVPWLQTDAGLGFAQTTLGNTSFGSLGIGNGQYVPVTGATLGLRHPSGLLAYMTVHLFPFHFRGLGIVTSFESVSLGTGNASNLIPPSSIDTSNGNGPTLTSVVVGPEAQARFGPFLVRGSALGGMRLTSFGDFTAYEWRLGFHGQGDWVVGGSGISLGLFAGADVYPALGWSTGMSVSFAFF